MNSRVCSLSVGSSEAVLSLPFLHNTLQEQWYLIYMFNSVQKSKWKMNIKN